MVAADFYTIEAWTRKGLTRFLVLFLIDLSSRRVQIAGVTRDGNGLCMSQVARNLSDVAEGFLIGKRYLIHDRDPLFTAEFLEIGVVPGTNDSVRRGLRAEGHPRICAALQLRFIMPTSLCH
jgi:hypothetical protein